MTDSPHPLRRVLAATRAQSSWADSSLHGEAHWRRVAANGLDLAAADPRCDVLVVLLFAMLHDSMRRNDEGDDDHGLRAGQLATRINEEWLSLSEQRLAVLVGACTGHAGGKLSSDSTVGCCWDADRLDLWRVGIEPLASYLSTAAGRDPETIAAARARLAQSLSWDEVFARFDSIIA